MTTQDAFDLRHRSAGAPIELRSARGNSRLGGSVATKSMRQEMEQKLTGMFSGFPKPLVFPTIFVDCKDCGSLHVLPWDRMRSHLTAVRLCFTDS
jgi:hypothetical protein